MRFGLHEKTLALLRSVFERYPELLQVKIYGSRARGDQRPGSDIDLALFYKGRKDISPLILWDLEELPLPYLFDAVRFESLPQGPLKREIEVSGRALYTKAHPAAEREKRNL